MVSRVGRCFAASMREILLRIMPTADQPADRAGVLSQDVILAVDDIAVDRVGEVLRVIKGTEVGNEVTLTIFRSGETFVVPVKLGKKPIAQDDPEE
jgi:S1-C subfamily serine protease